MAEQAPGDGVRERLRQVLLLFPKALARLGVVDREPGVKAFDLALPVMLAAGFRILQQVADFLMVSLALGESAVAGLEIGFQYYFIGFGLSLAVSSGTISVVARSIGAEQREQADVALKQSLWLSILLSVPLTVASWLYAEPMVALLTDDPAVIAQGAVYLRVVMLSLVFRFWSMVAARAMFGAGDTRTPMYVRFVTIPVNLVLNAVLIFGLGPAPRMGVAGAAWGTAVANTLAGLAFLALLVTDRFPVRLRIRGRQLDPSIALEVVRVGFPLGATRLTRTIGRFPFLFVLSGLGTGMLAAYAIARRVILLAIMPAWGYATSASTLVGQALGASDEDEATYAGWQTLRIGVATQAIVAGLLAALARPIATAFASPAPELTVAFLRVFAVGVLAYAVARAARGALRGAGDAMFPLYGVAVGTVLRLAIAFTALPATFVVGTVAGWTIAPGLGLGVAAVFAAILVDWTVRAAVNTARFASGRWKQIARQSAIGPDPG
jgi:putative MATE family efflux protein